LDSARRAKRGKSKMLHKVLTPRLPISPTMGDVIIASSPNSEV
jgi:hypothetical protein